MHFKSSIAKFAANIIAPSIYREHEYAISIQQNLLLNLVQSAANTDFGKAHHFSEIKNYDDFKAAVRIRDYEDFKDYIELIADGREDVLWRGKPLYFCTTSGTTSGTKYIPV